MAGFYRASVADQIGLLFFLFGLMLDVPVNNLFFSHLEPPK